MTQFYNQLQNCWAAHRFSVYLPLFSPLSLVNVVVPPTVAESCVSSWSGTFFKRKTVHVSKQKPICQNDCCKASENRWILTLQDLASNWRLIGLGDDAPPWWCVTVVFHFAFLSQLNIRFVCINPFLHNELSPINDDAKLVWSARKTKHEQGVPENYRVSQTNCIPFVWLLWRSHRFNYLRFHIVA